MSPTGAAGDSTVGADTARRSKRKLSARAVALRLGMAVLVALLALEGLLTLAVHSDVAPNSPFLAGLRDPWVYGSYSTDDEYWEVRFLRKDPAGRADNPERDARLGWTSDRSQPLATLLGRSAGVADLPDLILVGDSYARGVYPETWHDFESMAASSGLCESYDVVNAGVGGFGFDQACLMAERELDRRAGERDETKARPLLLVSLLVDDDLDRCVLDFRDWPKPRFEMLPDGDLHLAQPEVPTVEEYFEDHARIGPPFTPWMVRKVLRKLAGEPPGGRGTSEKQELARALVGRVVEKAEAAGFGVMFVLFLYSSSLEDLAGLGWRLGVLERELEARGVPWVNVRPAFLEHMQRSGLPMNDYFLPPEHASSGHYNALGDAIAFQTVFEALAKHFGVGSGGNLCVVQDVRPVTGHAGAPPRWSAFDERLYGLGLQPPYIHVAGEGDLELGIRFQGATCAGTIRARASVLGSPASQTSIEIVRNGAIERTLPVDDSSPTKLEVSLAESDTLEIRVAGGSVANAAPAELVLSDVRHTPARPWVPPTR